MSYQSAGPECLKLSAFTDKGEAFVNTILYGTCTINMNVVQTLRKVVEKTTLVAVSVPHFSVLLA